MTIENLTLLTDLYQLTMMNGYYKSKIAQKRASFDLFFRRLPFSGGYCIAAGLQDALDYVANLHFSAEDIDYLHSQKLFSPEFLDWLKTFSFSGQINAIPEGTVVFPNEPLVSVTGPLIEVQFIETFFLNVINFQTLIATKAARIWEASGRAPIIEFGLRRAHGPNGAQAASRAAFIGGCEGTSNVLAAKKHSLPIRGTMAHSWVMAYPSELEAFRAYAETYPDSSVLLVDTYDTLSDGIPHAITVGQEMLSRGHHLRGVRLDSGDLAYLSTEARKQLDSAGLNQVKILASNDLDEWLIETLRHQGAQIDIWGVGTKLVTAGKESALGGVYKMVAMEDALGKMVPKIKLSQNVEKTTLPGEKALYRLFDQQNKMLSDILTLQDEPFPGKLPYTIHHPQVDYKFSRIDQGFRSERLLVPVYQNRQPLHSPLSLAEIQRRTKTQLDALHPTHRRLANPHVYKVGLSQALFSLRQQLIQENLHQA
jgi:nicotinate phosphoribosyltransferase